MEEYPYSIAQSTKVGKVKRSQLFAELRALPFSSALADMRIRDDTVSVRFDRSLTAAEKSQLDALVRAHEPREGEMRQEFEGAKLADLAPGRFEGQRAFVVDGRKSGEGANEGTGVPVYWSHGAWRRFRDDQPVTA